MSGDRWQSLHSGIVLEISVVHRGAVDVVKHHPGEFHPRLEDMAGRGAGIKRARVCMQANARLVSLALEAAVPAERAEHLDAVALSPLSRSLVEVEAPDELEAPQRCFRCQWSAQRLRHGDTHLVHTPV
jgi:hypothetical protein